MAPATRVDFEVDARDIADMLGAGAHLVGFSYGAIGSLLAAAMRPDAVHSLAVIEPPAFGVARGDPGVASLISRLEPVYARAGDMSPQAYDRAFDEALGLDHVEALNPWISSLDSMQPAEKGVRGKLEFRWNSCAGRPSQR